MIPANRNFVHLRLVVEGLVPLGVLPWVLSGVETVAVLSANAPICISSALISPQPSVGSRSTHPSSAGVMASALPPYRWRYHATEPIEKMVAPAGRALSFQEEPAPSAVEVEAERCITQFVSNCIKGHCRSCNRCRRAADRVVEACGSCAGCRGLPGVVPKLFCWRHCGLQRRLYAPYAVLIEPTW